MSISQESLEAERRLVLTCLTFPEAIERVDCNPSDLQSPRWRACMSVLVELYSQSREFDAVVLADEVVKRYGGAVTYADLAGDAGLPSMVGEYSRIIRTESTRKRLALALGTIQAQIDKEPPEAILEAISKLSRETYHGLTAGGVDIAELARERFKEYADIADARARGEMGETGFATGIDELDDTLGGLQPGIVTLLAARPSMGKSTVALNITSNINRAGYGVHIFSLEEPRAAYMDRVISLASKVSTEKLRNVELNAGEFADVKAGAERIFKRKHWKVDDRSGVRAEEIVRCVRLCAPENQTSVVVVDYINILKREVGEAKRDMMDHAINVFADAAKRDNMAYLVLAQLNRGLEHRDGDKEPKLSDLKECGTLEERAKAVIMIHHEHEYDRDAPEDIVRLIVRKNSQGKRGFVDAKWLPQRMYVGNSK